MGRVKLTPVKNQSRTSFTLNDVIAKFSEAPQSRGRRSGQKVVLPGQKVLLATTEHDGNYCGKVWVGETNNILSETYGECRAEIIHSENEDVLILHLDSDTVITRITTDVQFLKDIFSTKIFCMKFEVAEGQLSAYLYFLKLPIEKHTKRIGNVLKVFFNIVYQIGTEVLECENKTKLSDTQEISDFYNKIKELREKDIKLPDIEIDHPALNPILRPYQRDAVKWMISREKSPDIREDVLHPLYEEVKLESGLMVYFDKYSGYIATEKPLVRSLRTGGILADEMGLGKTVEVLACILLNPKKVPFQPKNPRTVIESDCSSDDSSDEIPLIKLASQNSQESKPETIVEKVEAETLPVVTESDHIHPEPVPNQFGSTLDESEPKPVFEEPIAGSSKQSLNATPIIERQERKRRFKKVSSDTSLEDDSKRIKVRDDWVKGSSKVSKTKLALQMWYESMLMDVTTRRAPQNVEPRVHCICGNYDESLKVEQCVECSKLQHSQCMGYKKSYGKYRCPQCWTEMDLLNSKATLIVCPLSLKGQWCGEICKHITGSLKVLEYDGAKSTPVYPTKLATYDLVITTYPVLQNELRISESGQTLTLRRQPRYSLPGSPITMIKWWRLCLDEAQTVETPGHMVSAMAQKLVAHHRWAVTGTPISRNVSDIHGLINYLQLEPYSEQDTWNHLLYSNYLKGDYGPLCKFLSKVLWRSAKDDVLHQIDIPKQTGLEHWIEFTAVERFFYDREHDLSSKDFLAKLSKFNVDTPLKALDKSSIKHVLAPLLSLRQACAHHNAVKGRYLATRKPVKSMDDLLDALIAKNISDCEECARVIISGLNGLAGISLLNQNTSKAIHHYRQVLQFVADFEKHNQEKGNKVSFTIDKLQMIHTLYNLHEILEINPDVDPTLRDDKLKEDWLALEKEYMQKHINQTLAALQEATKTTAAVAKSLDKFQLKLGQWYSDLLDWISETNLVDDLNARIATTFSTAGIQKHLRFQNVRKVFCMVGAWDEDINVLRERTLDAVNSLFMLAETENKILISNELVVSAMDCHLRQTKVNAKKDKCLVCKTNEQLKQYELKLFYMVNKNTTEDEIATKGNWKASTEEYIFKAIYSLGKVKNADGILLKDGSTHLRMLDAMKKEFKEVRRLWTFLDQQICAKDELDMCKIRLKLRDPNEKEKEKHSKKNKILWQLQDIEDNRLATIHLLDVHELDFQRISLQNDVTMQSNKLEKYFGTHSYLQTLRTQQTAGQSPDPCPICRSTLEKQWNMLACGHTYCLECIQVLIGQIACASATHITCSVCRQKIHMNDISFIQLDQKPVEPEEVKIKGNCSSKAEAVVKLVIKLKQQDASVKVLVFSNWVVLLKLLKVIFEMNDVSSELLHTMNLQKSLDKFKDESKGVTVLLLPVQLGSKGLNLIEASHVVFVEPLLNPGDELQAVGRVHRIGQTKPTFVHKFLVKNTIEENIHLATTSNADRWDSNKVTLKELKTLFEQPESTPMEAPEDAPRVNVETDLPVENNPSINHPQSSHDSDEQHSREEVSFEGSELSRDTDEETFTEDDEDSS